MVFPLNASFHSKPGESGLNANTGLQPMGEMILPGPGSGVDPFGFTDSPAALAPFGLNSSLQPEGMPSLWGGNTMSFAWPGLNANASQGPGVAKMQTPQGMPSSGGSFSGMVDFLKGLMSGLMYVKLSEKMLSDF